MISTIVLSTTTCEREHVFFRFLFHFLIDHMAAATSKTYCVTCKKEKVTFRCRGCSEDFCYQHLGDHQLELSKQFDEIEVNRDIFRQSLTEHMEQSNSDELFEQLSLIHI